VRTVLAREGSTCVQGDRSARCGRRRGLAKAVIIADSVGGTASKEASGVHVGKAANDGRARQGEHDANPVTGRYTEQLATLRALWLERRVSLRQLADAWGGVSTTRARVLLLRASGPGPARLSALPAWVRRLLDCDKTTLPREAA
jgi:hypothetical protein